MGWGAVLGLIWGYGTRVQRAARIARSRTNPPFVLVLDSQRDVVGRLGRRFRPIPVWGWHVGRRQLRAGAAHPEPIVDELGGVQWADVLHQLDSRAMSTPPCSRGEGGCLGGA